MILKKKLVKEYTNFYLYEIYRDDKFVYRTTEPKIKDTYVNKNIVSDKADALMRGDV